jgi:hypothetical protein
MNKLYKYLPFDIKVCIKSISDRTSYLGTLISLDQDCCYIIDENGIKRDSKLSQTIPLLKPFKNVFKPLIINKFQASLIKKKNKSTINVLVEFFTILLNIPKHCSTINEEYIFYNEKQTYFSYCTNNICITFYKDWNYIIENCVNHSFNFEKAFDFLRAMKFAVDFKEDRYIKFED